VVNDVFNYNLGAEILRFYAGCRSSCIGFSVMEKSSLLEPELRTDIMTVYLRATGGI